MKQSLFIFFNDFSLTRKISLLSRLKMSSHNSQVGPFTSHYQQQKATASVHRLNLRCTVLHNSTSILFRGWYDTKAKRFYDFYHCTTINGMGISISLFTQKGKKSMDGDKWLTSMESITFLYNSSVGFVMY